MQMNVGPLVISAAHFIHTCTPDSPCQRLHGHNYIVNVSVFGEPDKCNCMLIDANIVKKVVDKYDHRTLISRNCIQAEFGYGNENNTIALYAIMNPTTKMVYMVPVGDCHVLDIPATSAEWLAKAIATDIIKLGSNVLAVEVNLSETPKLNVTARENKTTKSITTAGRLNNTSSGIINVKDESNIPKCIIGKANIIQAENPVLSNIAAAFPYVHLAHIDISEGDNNGRQ